jgi:hypothetical protein
MMAAMGTSCYATNERRKCVSEEEEVRDSESSRERKGAIATSQVS